MSGSMKKGSSKTPKRLRTSIRFDPISPSDYLRYQMPSACEDCTHFDSVSEKCTMGYDPQWHRKKFQEQSYFLTGKMALCRFLEID
jgi:hypothetical protein